MKKLALRTALLIVLACAMMSFNVVAEYYVYVTDTGTKYHRNGCGFLAYSSQQLDINDAILQGYSPCEVCAPPTREPTIAERIEMMRTAEVSPGETETPTTPTTIKGKLIAAVNLHTLIAAAGVVAVVLSALIFYRVGRNKTYRSTKMDITLERILSLIPRKPDGKYVHGAKKEFAESIGLKGGNLVSDWEAGRVNSYRNYLYEIADKYDVSVEWLKGETDLKTKKAAPQMGDDFAEKFAMLTPQNQDLIRQMVESLAKAQADT